MMGSERVLKTGISALGIADWRVRLNGFITGNLFVWLSLAIYRYSAYYNGFLNAWTQKILIYLAVIYSAYSLFYYLTKPLGQVSQSRSRLAAAAIKKIALSIYNFLIVGPFSYKNKLVSLNMEEKRALLFGFVKFFFIPMMISFLYINYTDFWNNAHQLNTFGSLFSVSGFNYFLYPLIFSFFLVVDTAFFTFGYLFESSSLKNKVRSVDPTFLGWIVVLICYPPFNGSLTSILPWYPNDSAVVSSPLLTFAIRLAALVFIGIYASASVALGPKASNLTNRGIVGYGPYKFIRHPAYISKNLVWWVTMLPVFGLGAVLSMTVWSFIYFMRALTEERHLAADPDYTSYCKKVKYRFIPGVL